MVRTTGHCGYYLPIKWIEHKVVTELRKACLFTYPSPAPSLMFAGERIRLLA
jgi:hypothetical protein